ncbi:chaperone regulator [Macrolepiota fuliginosa MF-IS2]|uniref:Chaperone regulator n=1 Tax=Macrolepiota fuliginosa MF-IS2 TaxID=1400762 RepID=A0A9P6C881_9AGAR|nr:chaperone regulator [Macrolepiota fuliginosa MF-IS2]
MSNPSSAQSSAGATPAESSKASTPAASSSKKADDEIEKLLNREASAFQREVEVERILKAFKLNAYDILDLDVSATPEEIKKKYRQLSLFIHPDKTPHARAPEAFDILKKAESELSDKNKREELDAVINQARITILKSLNLPTSTADNDYKLREIGEPSFRIRVRAKAKDMLIEEEVRRRKAIKMNLANEGLEARKKDEEVAARKRKAEDEKVWEDTREQRVDSWRTFANNNSRKKKKQKVALLG